MTFFSNANSIHDHRETSWEGGAEDNAFSAMGGLLPFTRFTTHDHTYLNLRLDVVVVVAEEVRPRASHDGDVVDPLVPLHDLLVHGRRLRPTALEGPRHRVVVVHHVHALAALLHLRRKVDRVSFGVGIGVGDDANTVVQ